MSNRITLEPIFILHQRPFSNTSLIIDMFSLHHGRVSAVARSARGHQSRYRGMLQLFTPMLVCWSGRNELKTLGQVELDGSPYQINHAALFCGFYVNELLVQLLHRDDPHPILFSHYQELLVALQSEQQLQQHLRYFEKKLLHELGYGLPLFYEAQSRSAIMVDAYYQYVPEKGFIHCENSFGKEIIFLGDSLIALRDETLTTDLHLRDAKRLMRMVLAKYLNGKILKSRELMI